MYCRHHEVCSSDLTAYNSCGNQDRSTDARALYTTRRTQQAVPITRQKQYSTGSTDSTGSHELNRQFQTLVTRESHLGTRTARQPALTPCAIPAAKPKEGVTDFCIRSLAFPQQADSIGIIP